MDSKSKSLERGAGWFAGGGLLSGLGALIGASCCVLPALLAQAGISVALISQIGLLARFKPYLLAATAILVAAGFYAAFRGSRRPRLRVVLLLAAAASLIAASVALPYIEPTLLRAIRP